MDLDQSAPLQRSTSQLSCVSGRSNRASSSRAKSRSRWLASQPSSSASSIATSDKSLTSFPSFSPQETHHDRPEPPTSVETVIHVGPPSRPSTLVDSLTTTEAARTPRDALFYDHPVASRHVPGVLHISDDAHIERLLAKYGSVNLVRQIAEDLAERDKQISQLRRRAEARERALRKIILECGLSNLQLERKLRSVEQELEAEDQSKLGDDDGLSSMMSDAMQDSLSRTTSTGLGIDNGYDTTVRASGQHTPKENKGTVRGWKDYFWGTGTGKKSNRTGNLNGEGVRTAIRAPVGGDRRPAIQEDLFTPPEAGSTQTSSRASSIYSGHGTTRKPSASLASKALQLVAGKSANRTDSDSLRGRSDSVRQEGSLRTSSITSTKTRGSARASSSQPGPRALMSMRRPTASAVNIARRTQNYERREGLGTSPEDTTEARPDNYVPVEMDTIFSPEGQPPTLTHIYNNRQNGDFLTDTYGFIYDQRRKLRQKEAAQVAAQIKGGNRTEMLTGGRSGISPTELGDNASSAQETASDDRPGSPNSTEYVAEQGKLKRWQDYLRIATIQTELLAHTPVATSSLEVLEGGDPPRSPGLITTNERGFVPPASSTTAALNSDSTTREGEEAPGTLVHEDTEPVRLLLKQLSDVHDALQREKSVRWNEFLRKVRAERRRESEAAAAAAAAAAEARFQKAPVMIPEAKLTDGETIGIADLGVKGKVGRAKWYEFRSLVLGGIPVANRPKVWAECSGALSIRIPGYYEDLVSRSGDDDDPNVVTQIACDVNRTLTDNIFFRRGPGVAKLSEVLRAYARRNPEVGYCQGMNLITANLLLIMPSTEDTFWVLVSIIEFILPHGYYDHSLIASRADQVVLRQYVAAVLPKLSQHLEALSIELEALTFQWFLSVFTDCLSAEALFRVWDVVLCISDGSTFLFQVALRS
ncbi:hypothetical protein NPX13_g974 [Xylaria arbuscula]|uniref:Rab-GAP TBC domain-containing protein n=1 Tax=Xylaria arbuscula TaxID=114810 RepID=A0A9W8TRL4_9PEZI|nr:hypothetical protein NPX13_g974 [Xylaria arbuscula]